MSTTATPVATPDEAPPAAPRAARITEILTAALAPDLLQLRDESHLHAGHNAAAAQAGQTHFRLVISSARFCGLTRIEQHRLVNDLLRSEFDSGLHALALTTRIPATA